jgi:hypothetical protein
VQFRRRNTAKKLQRATECLEQDPQLSDIEVCDERLKSQDVQKV